MHDDSARMIGRIHRKSVLTQSGNPKNLLLIPELRYWVACSTWVGWLSPQGPNFTVRCSTAEIAASPPRPLLRVAWPPLGYRQKANIAPPHGWRPIGKRPGLGPAPGTLGSSWLGSSTGCHADRRIEDLCLWRLG